MRPIHSQERNPLSKRIACGAMAVAGFVMALFMPSARQASVLVLLGCATLGCGLYLRLSVLGDLELAAACEAGQPHAVCVLRRIGLEFQELQLFAGAAIATAAYHFFRPSLSVFAAALVASLLGLAMGNASVSAFAVALLVMSFARPAPASSSMPVPAAPPPTTAPASSRTFH